MHQLHSRLKKRDLLFCLAFLAPAFLLYVAFRILPIGLSVSYSLTQWNGFSPPKLIGLDNYRVMFQSLDYWIVLVNTFMLIGAALFIQIPLALILSYLIYNTSRGYKFFRSACFLPVVIAPAGIAIMFTLFFNGDFGPLNKLLHLLGLSGLERQWLSDPNTVLFAVIAPMIWQYLGFFIILFLAALQSIPVEIFESARLDGANSTIIFGRMVVPLLWDITQISIILNFTSCLRAFDHAYIMTWGGPGYRSSFLGLYMYRTAFYDSFLGLGSSIAITALVISLVFTVVFKKYLSTEPIQY
jgi:raffinose/stachyose/melibiose transport system permease protein